MTTDTGTAIFGGTYITAMRKDEIRKGYVSRSFNIPEKLDERLKIKAAKDKVRFSDITISAHCTNS